MNFKMTVIFGNKQSFVYVECVLNFYRIWQEFLRKIQVKYEVVTFRAMKACSGSGDVTPFILITSVLSHATEKYKKKSYSASWHYRNFADKGRAKFAAPGSGSFCLGLLLHLHLPAKFVILLVPFSFNNFLSRLNLEAEELFNYLGFPAPPQPPPPPKAKLTIPLPIF
jgi:hypothetical protein